MELTQEVVRELLDYEPETGKLFWKERDVKYFRSEGYCRAWNEKYPGTQAFNTLKPDGYLCGRVLIHRLQTHQLICMYMLGYFPDEVDHVNGKHADNRWVNLEPVTRKENAKNLPKRKDNTSGHVGVAWHKVTQKWMAYISVNKKLIHLGLFETFENAVAARKEAEIKYGYHKNHGRD